MSNVNHTPTSAANDSSVRSPTGTSGHKTTLADVFDRSFDDYTVSRVADQDLLTRAQRWLAYPQ